MCSAGDFQTAEHQHVLPADVDLDDEDPTVPAEEFNGTVDGLATAASSDDAPQAMTDGGEDLDEHDDGDDEQDDVNEFDCPKCGTHLTGYPDECPDCAVPYRWDADGEDN